MPTKHECIDLEYCIAPGAWVRPLGLHHKNKVYHPRHSGWILHDKTLWTRWCHGDYQFHCKVTPINNPNNDILFRTVPFFSGSAKRDRITSGLFWFATIWWGSFYAFQEAWNIYKPIKENRCPECNHKCRLKDKKKTLWSLKCNNKDCVKSF